MRIAVNTFGSVSARSASSSTQQSLTCWRDFLRISVTSTAEHAPTPISNSSIGRGPRLRPPIRSEEHTSELQSLMRSSYAVFCLKKKKKQQLNITSHMTYLRRRNRSVIYKLL